MNNEVLKAMEKSAYQFTNIVFPRIQSIVGYGELISCESMLSDKFKKVLDIESGIDYAILLNYGGIRFLATRVLKSNKRNLTVRFSRPKNKTEYQKRVDSIINNKLYPYYSVQGNVTVDDVYMFTAIIKTFDLYKHVHSNFDYYIKGLIENRDHSSSYLSIPFSDFGNKLIVI